jgi:hypothetical protein
VIHSSGFPVTRGRNISLLRAKAAAEHVVAKIVDSGRDIQGKIVGGKRPSMKFPLRLLSNVRYTPKKGCFEMVGKEKERTLTTVKTFAQTLRVVALSKRLIETDDRATQRDAQARRAAGLRDVRPQLRHGRVPAGEAEPPREVPALTAREPR